jgi:hypothetical protein
MGEASYKGAYQYARRVQDISEGTIGVGVRIVPKYQADIGTTIPLRAWVDSGELSRELPVRPTNIVALTADPEFANPEAKIYLNRRQDEVRSSAIVLFPTASPDSITLGVVRRTLAHSADAMKVIVPSWLSFLAPSNLAFSICGASNDGTLTVTVPGGTVDRRPMSARAKDDGGETVWCHHFLPTDAAPNDAIIAPPPGAQILLLSAK